MCSDIRVVGKRVDIISEGDTPQYAHLVLSGWAARYRILPNGARQIMAFLLPGDFCDLHYTVLTTMDHAIIALTDCHVAYIDSHTVERVISANTCLTRAFCWAARVDEAISREWVVNNGRRNTYQALAHLLCELHLRLELIGLSDDNRMALPLTQEMLSDAIGVSGIHVNRVLLKLRTEGLIVWDRGLLMVPDPEALRQAAGFTPAYLHLKRNS
jgi:CRP-like cAMP-binding protein